MKMTRIEGATRDMAKGQDEYQTLPIQDIETEHGNVMVSAWLPTHEELEQLNAGKPIHLYVFGIHHPPVFLTVEGVRD